MFTFDKIDMQRFTVSSLGALALSATCMLGATAPARAATPAPLSVAAWQSTVEHRVEAMAEPSGVFQPASLARSDVAVRFTADGDYAGAVVARSSGDLRVDRRALRLARRIAYPAMPADLRGAPTVVTMQLYFGQGPQAEADYQALRDRAGTVQIARADDGKGTQIAAR